MKLALGTVQFGLDYGLANTSGQVSIEQVRAILDHARAHGIDTLDTAIAYGNSEERLGELGVSGWKVVSKLPGLPQGLTDVGRWVNEQIQGSLQRLRVERLDGLLLHRPADLLGPKGRDYSDVLRQMKDQDKVTAIGYSIYSPDELPALCSFLQPDLIQAPFNIIDHRLLSSGWMDRLRHQGVRIHTRSTFMQGLLLMSESRRPAWFDRWSPIFSKWSHACAHSSPLNLALGYVLSFPQIERVVVGVDNVAQLGEIIRASRVSNGMTYPDIESKDMELLDPTRWQLN